MKCPACGEKKGRHRLGCELMGLHLRRQIEPPPRFGGTPVAPVDPVQAHLAQIEEWAGTVNQRLAALEAPQAYPDGAPPGVVSPHVKRNLEALAAWCDPKILGVPRSIAPDFIKVLDEIHAKIMVAIAGGDVEPPRTL